MSADEIRERNLVVLAQLRGLGDDLEATHEIDHFFYGPDASLEALRDALIVDGLTCEASGDGRLHMVGRMPLASDAIHALTDRLHALAERAGVDYDGWGTACVRRAPSLIDRLRGLVFGALKQKSA